MMFERRNRSLRGFAGQVAWCETFRWIGLDIIIGEITRATQVDGS
jgi:hypothetical protein